MKTYTKITIAFVLCIFAGTFSSVSYSLYPTEALAKGVQQGPVTNPTPKPGPTPSGPKTGGDGGGPKSGGGEGSNPTSPRPQITNFQGETVEIVNSNTVYENGSTRTLVTNMTSFGTFSSGGTTYTVYGTSGGGPLFVVATGGGGGGGGGGGYTAPTCSGNNVNLVIEDIFFVKTGSATSTSVDQNQLIVGVSYDPIIQIKNYGCRATAENGFFINQMPYGRNGSFPSYLRVDFGKNGTYEVANFVDNQGPVAGGATIFVRFPAVPMTTPGLHKINSIVDSRVQVGSVLHGCAPVGGFITESGQPASDLLEEEFRVVRPTISLGSFLINEEDLIYSTLQTINGANLQPLRTISLGSEVGLYWTGSFINFATCTGTSVSSRGVSGTDFNGQKNTTNLSNQGILGLPVIKEQVDSNIVEPRTPGISHTYSISCRTAGGTVVTDSLQIVAQAAQGCWMDNVSNTDSSCGTICSVAGGVPATDSTGAECMSSLSRPSSAMAALGSGVPNPFYFGCRFLDFTFNPAFCTAQGAIVTKNFGNMCLPSVITPGGGLAGIVGCYCNVPSATPIANNRCSVTPPVPPTITECNNTVDDADPEDALVDALDPGCWTNPTNPSTYNPLDTTELSLPSVVPVVSNLTVDSRTVVSAVPFTTRNNGQIAVTNYQYTVTIGGVERGRGTRTVPLGLGITDTFSGVIAYTAPVVTTNTNFPLRVCVTTIGMTAPVCDDAVLTVVPLPVVSLVPAVNNLTVNSQAVITEVPFTTRNDGQVSITSYTYTISIAGTQRGSAVRTTTLGLNQTDTIPGRVSYTAPAVTTRTTVPVRVCVITTGMTGSVCDDAIVTIIPTQCADRIDNTDPEDILIDRADPGCYGTGNPNVPGDYDPTDNSEADSSAVVPVPSVFSLTATNQVVRFDTSTTIRYQIRNAAPMSCVLRGPGTNRTFLYTMNSVVDQTLPTSNLKSAQSFSLTCTPILIGPAITRTLQIEVIPQVQEV